MHRLRYPFVRKIKIPKQISGPCRCDHELLLSQNNSVRLSLPAHLREQHISACPAPIRSLSRLISLRFPRSFHCLFRRRKLTQFCRAQCEGQGFDYYSTQFARECWCGSGAPEDTYNRYEELDEATGCDMPCTGDANESCGGHLAASVYAYTTTD